MSAEAYFVYKEGKIVEGNEAMPSSRHNPSAIPYRINAKILKHPM